MTKLIIPLTLLALAFIASPASADVRSGSISDPADMYRPLTDLNACQNPDVERVEAVYSTNGVFRITFRFYSPITGTECGDNNGIEAFAALEGPSGTPYALIRINEWQAGEDLTAKLDLQGVYPSFIGVAEYGSDSRSLIATFSDSGLASRNYRSVDASTRNNWTTDMSEDGRADNVDKFYFAGYEPAVDPGPPSPPPTPAPYIPTRTPSAPSAPRPTCSDDPASSLPWCNQPVATYSPPFLTKSKAKTYMRTTLRGRFSSYKYGNYKRLNRCKRLSRGKVRCNASWSIGDSWFHGRISIRFEKQGAVTVWNNNYRITHTDTYCRSVMKRKNCNKTYKLAW